jgi:energy-coupling factor transport system permease protein
VSLLGPLLIGALVSTQTRSLALEARGFSLDGPRTSLYTLSPSRLDWALRAGGVVGVVGLVGWRLL